MRGFFTCFVTAAALAVAFCPLASADELNITGDVQVAFGALNFYPLGGSSGTFNIDPVLQTGVFAPLAGTTGTVQDLNNTMEPVGVPVNVTDFMTFSAGPNLSITLTLLPAGTDSSAQCSTLPAAGGQTCTPPGTQYNLSNQSATSSTASFNVEGMLVDSSGGTSTPISGTFTTQFSNMNYQQVEAAIFGGGTVQASFSANFTTMPSTTTPEPGSAMMLGTGILLVAGAMIGRRFKGLRTRT